MKPNCWEYMKCGKEQECKAYPDNGRICWSVTGTLCGGETQGGFATKKDRCKECRFNATLETSI